MGLDAKHFIGQHTPKLDDKGRLFLPAKFRPRLVDGVVLMQGMEHCIFGWTIEAYEGIADRLRELPFTNRASRNFQRMRDGGFEPRLGARPGGRCRVRHCGLPQPGPRPSGLPS